MRGTIVSYNKEKCYGFIEPENGGPDIMFHLRNISADESGLHGVKVGAAVEFETGDGDRASAVRVLWDASHFVCRGWVESFDQNRAFGFLLGEDGQRYFFHLNDVLLDPWLRQKPTTEVGTEVNFHSNGTSRGQAFSALNQRLRFPSATRITPVFGLDEPIDLISYREVSTVKSWDAMKGVGFLNRPCGDELGFMRKHILTEGEETLAPGSQLYHGVARRIPACSIGAQGRLFCNVRHCVLITAIEIVRPEKVATSITTTPLLSDRLKHVQLKNIRIRKIA